ITKEQLQKIDSDFKNIIMPRTLSTLPITVEELRSLYFGDKAVSEKTLKNCVDFMGDEYFTRDIMEVVDIQTKLKNDKKATYLYQYSYESETSPMRKIFDINFPGASHDEDLAYLFYPNLIKDLGMSPPAIDSEDYKMMNCLTQMWTDFAKTGYEKFNFSFSNF
ncbi:PREDICTED: juvenile hormone esterase-like, partial [Wasmannia auropunctata]|uniref:juvenile hormone esterase-like n=1 Tax=Wasmannia auropunctata TaxID=64793 RepID=UPI0005EF4872